MLNYDTTLFYTHLQSQETARQYLQQCYKKLNGVDAEAKSYENCNAFMYYLDHGRQFLSAGVKSPELMQPILLFYGATHLLKACILTKRPNYPESTSILAHGVSTRKRKKKQYTFIRDEVKIQHNGLFSYAAQHVYNIRNFPFEKINMEDLFSLIPEMNDLFLLSGEEKLVAIGNIDSTILHFPLSLLDTFHLTEKAFVKRISNHLPSIITTKVGSSTIQLQLTKPIEQTTGPFFVELRHGKVYFPKNREHFLAIPEVLVHYLLLYNLSMVSRYETEWWGELLALKAERDYPFIKQFLAITAWKMPMLLGNELVALAHE
ncbi:YaaC family protein [Virgibacillus sp. FSP13]